MICSPEAVNKTLNSHNYLSFIKNLGYKLKPQLQKFFTVE